MNADSARAETYSSNPLPPARQCRGLRPQNKSRLGIYLELSFSAKQERHCWRQCCRPSEFCPKHVQGNRRNQGVGQVCISHLHCLTVVDESRPALAVITIGDKPYGDTPITQTFQKPLGTLPVTRNTSYEVGNFGLGKDSLILATMMQAQGAAKSREVWMSV
jgi:hypothetical protein